MISFSNTNIFTVISIVVAIIILFFIFYSIILKPFKKSNSSFVVFSFIAFVVSIASFFMTLTNNNNFALILAYIEVFGFMLQPIALLILIVSFSGYKNSKLKEIRYYLLYLIPAAIIAILFLTQDINIEKISLGYIADVSSMKFLGPLYITIVNIFAAFFLGFEIHRRKKLNRFSKDVILFLVGIILYILAESTYQSLLMAKLVIKIPSSSISIILFYLFILISLFSIKASIHNISMKKAFENIQDCIIISDYRGDIVEFNECIKEKLIVASENKLKQDYSSENLKKLISKMISSKNQSDGFFKLLENNSKDKSKFEMIIKNNGNLLTYDISISPIVDKSNNIIGKISIFRDITLKKEYENKIKYFSFHDKLTGLYNRRYFEEELKRLDTKRQLPISIIMADIDGLKYVNDNFGHDLGDGLIINASKIIKNSCREEDVISRWGGDEFIILLSKTSEKDANEVINRIRKACNSKKPTDKIKISISLGFSTKNELGKNIEEIIKQADKNMYGDKARLKNYTKLNQI